MYFCNLHFFPRVFMCILKWGWHRVALFAWINQQQIITMNQYWKSLFTPEWCSFQRGTWGQQCHHPPFHPLLMHKATVIWIFVKTEDAMHLVTSSFAQQEILFGRITARPIFQCMHPFQFEKCSLQRIFRGFVDFIYTVWLLDSFVWYTLTIQHSVYFV